MINIQDKKLLFISYLLAHGGLFFILNAIYWDDWVFYKAGNNDIIGFGKTAGWMMNLQAYLHIGMLKFGPWFYRVSTFILFFLSGILLDGIISKYEAIKPEVRFATVLLFLVAPFNLSRSLISVFQYTLCYFLFFYAWHIYQKNKFISLTVFFISFNTNSLLVFYIIPVTEILFMRLNKTISIKLILNRCMKNKTLLILPFIYYFIKRIFFKPNGSFEGYNEGFSVASLFKGPIFQLLDIFKVDINIGLTLTVSVLMFFIYRHYRSIRISFRQSLIGMLVGLVILVIGLFPYWILGYVPSFTEWSTRHQLLMPLGFSILIVFFYTLLLQKNPQYFLYLLLVFLFLTIYQIISNFILTGKNKSKLYLY